MDGRIENQKEGLEVLCLFVMKIVLLLEVVGICKGYS